MERILERSRDWEQFPLQRNESKTILCNLLDAPTPPQQADIVIGVDYRPLPFLPWTIRKLVRFTGAYADQWQWLRQPVGPIESETNRSIDKMADTGRSRYAFKGCIQWRSSQPSTHATRRRTAAPARQTLKRLWPARDLILRFLCNLLKLRILGATFGKVAWPSARDDLALGRACDRA